MCVWPLLVVVFEVDSPIKIMVTVKDPMLTVSSSDRPKDVQETDLPGATIAQHARLDCTTAKHDHKATVATSTVMQQAPLPHLSGLRTYYS